MPFWTMFNTMPFAGHALAKGSEAILLQAAPLFFIGFSSDKPIKKIGLLFFIGFHKYE